MAMAESRAVWIVSALAVLTLTVVSGVDDKCSACYAVADELERGLSNEKPRNHLDMRNRLNSKGQREGKVIDYRVSDLRVVELLDGLCDKMQDYTLQKVDSSRSAWVKVDSWDKLTSDKQEARAHSKAMSSYCGRLLEETEDELADLIKKGSVNVGGVSKVLCQDLSKHCKSSDTRHETDSNDSDSASDSDSDDEAEAEL
ncbi:Protein canopy-1 [Euphorbia peplus]|nr:Protein canopy-1 [Euphorbia peplus]